MCERVFIVGQFSVTIGYFAIKAKISARKNPVLFIMMAICVDNVMVGVGWGPFQEGGLTNSECNPDV